MPRQVETIEFRIEDTGPVVDAMRRLSEVHDGWLNLAPFVPDEDVPPAPSGLWGLLSGPAHDVPLCTWVPGGVHRDSVAPDSLGIQHSAGTRAVALLRSVGVVLPNGWRPVQDHPRRGLVVQVPAGTPMSDELSWLMEAGAALSKVPIRAGWIAEVHSHS